MKPDKIYSMLGLATKAGKVVSGEFSVEKAVKAGRGWLVIVTADASDNTKKMFTNMCSYYETPIYFYGTKDELGHAIGKQMRVSLAVTDERFANSIMGMLEDRGAPKGEHISEEDIE